MKHINTVFILLTIFCFQKISYGQENSMEFEITFCQLVFPGPNPVYQYIISQKYLSVNEIYFPQNASVDQKIKRKLFRKKLNQIQRDSIFTILNSIEIENLENEYVNAVLDGVIWYFSFTDSKVRKYIKIDNYYLEELNTLLVFINRQLPEKRQYIFFQVL
jgi:hypothetical protein